MNEKDNENKYYLIRKRAVPEVLLKVIEAKRLLDSEKGMTVQKATELVGIGRSSFYKYKDDIHLSTKMRKEAQLHLYYRWRINLVFCQIC